MPDFAVSCRALVKRYPGGVVAVDGLDLDVAVGECFGLLGPNGPFRSPPSTIRCAPFRTTERRSRVLARPC